MIRDIATPPSHSLFASFLQYVGSLDVPRPNSRVEIVAAMRRIRVSGQRWGCVQSYPELKFPCFGLFQPEPREPERMAFPFQAPEPIFLYHWENYCELGPKVEMDVMVERRILPLSCPAALPAETHALWLTSKGDWQTLSKSLASI